MCGVFAVVTKGNPVASGESVFRSMRHRGPDSFGYLNTVINGLTYEFGHTRLSIRDLSQAGSQPMHSACKRWLLSYNGEIYNSEALRADLGGSFKGLSDTETLVQCLSRYGIEKTLSKVNGMFAFVALDTRTGELYAARDTSGIKPLYFAELDNGGIAFSSEVRALQDHGLAGSSVDHQALARFLQFRYVPGGTTLFAGIKRLSAGEWLRWTPGTGVQLHRFEFSPATHANESADFGQAMQEAVRRQLVSDVPVGVLLSGGVDSAVVAALLKRVGATPPCFTVGFVDDAQGVCEVDAAAQTAKLLGLPHHAVTLGVDDLLNVSDRVTRHLEEPLGTHSVLAMWHLCELAREHVTVALAGQGADEPLGGYRRHRVEALRSNMPDLARWMVRGGAQLMKRGPFPARAQSLVSALGDANWYHAYQGLRTVFSDDEIRKFGLEPASTDNDALVGVQSAQCANRSDLSRALGMDVRTQLADDLLLYGDKISMAHSLEVRVPFLDNEVLSLVESLPDKQRVTARRSKVVLREYAKQLLPASIINRKKLGFAVPNIFCNEQLVSRAKELAAAALQTGQLGLNLPMVLKILDAGKQGGAHEVRAWSIYSLINWHHVCLTHHD